MTEPGEHPVALWYDRHHVRCYSLQDTERDAAGLAVSLKEYEEGVPIGVQFADGRTLTVDQWPAYQQVQAEQDAEWIRQPPRPTREVLDPFDGATVVVDADVPRWLGRGAALS